MSALDFLRKLLQDDNQHITMFSGFRLMSNCIHQGFHGIYQKFSSICSCKKTFTFCILLYLCYIVIVIVVFIYLLVHF